MGTVFAPSDRELARLAGPLRVLKLSELQAAGLSEKAMRHRLAQGRLQRLWPGVFLVGPDPADPLSLALGAASSFTGAAYVTDRWGCFVHGFAPSPGPPVDVLVVSGTRHRRSGVLVHRSRSIGPGDVGHVRGVPVVSAARAILSVAETATPAQVEALIADAHAARAVTQPQLEGAIRRAGRAKGARRLAAVLSEQTGMTLSEAERILRRLLKQAGLPQPFTDYAIGRYRADFCWPALGLIVEFDSWAHHGHRQGFRHDRRRNSDLAAKGWSILPVTDEMLRNEPFRVVALITEAVTRRQTA